MPIEQRNLERFMDLARVKCTGASDAGIKAELFEVLREFFNDSNAWQTSVTFSTVAGQTNYVVSPGSEGQVLRLAGVLDSNLVPQAALMPDIGTIVLQSAPNTVQAMTAYFVKTVDLPTIGKGYPLVPDALFKKYFSPVLDGVLGHLMSQQNKSYSDAKMANYHLARYRTGIAKARVETQRANTSGAGSWRFPQTFASRGQRGGISVGNPAGF